MGLEGQKSHAEELKIQLEVDLQKASNLSDTLGEDLWSPCSFSAQVWFALHLGWYPAKETTKQADLLISPFPWDLPYEDPKGELSFSNERNYGLKSRPSRWKLRALPLSWVCSPCFRWAEWQLWVCFSQLHGSPLKGGYDKLSQWKLHVPSNLLQNNFCAFLKNKARRWCTRLLTSNIVDIAWSFIQDGLQH